MGSEAERQERRALIETILAQDLNGPPNDPGFQQVVDRVFGAIESDATGSALLTRVLQNMVDR